MAAAHRPPPPLAPREPRDDLLEKRDVRPSRNPLIGVPVVPLEGPGNTRTLAAPTVERDLETARECIRNLVAAFRTFDLSEDQDLRSVVQQGVRMQTQLALNAGRRARRS